MQERSLFKIFTDRFNKIGAPYMITGSVASIIYGEPRVTHDIDIVVTIPISSSQKIFEFFPEKEFYLPPIEVINNEILRENRGHCNIIHHESGFKADIYFCGDDDFQHWGLENRKFFDFLDSQIAVAPAEYLIVKKLEFYKEGGSQKHLSDIKGIFENYSEHINFEMLNGFIDRFNLKKEWTEVDNY
jgi:hypothetical protein